MNEITRLRQLQSTVKSEARDRALAENPNRLVWLIPDEYYSIENEIKRLRRIAGPRRGTSAFAHRNRRA